MYEYNIKVVKVVDGDTVDVDIDLGFGMTYKKQRVRMMGIDTPESRTRDLVEKKFGKASKKHLKQLLESAERLSLVSHDKGKFGRILGEIFAHHAEGHPVYETEISINQQMIDDHHAVDYGGGNKEEIAEQHLKNRNVLVANGTVEL
jgi:micrococcal nuclease